MSRENGLSASFPAHPGATAMPGVCWAQDTSTAFVVHKCGFCPCFGKNIKHKQYFQQMDFGELVGTYRVKDGSPSFLSLRSNDLSKVTYCHDAMRLSLNEMEHRTPLGTDRPIELVGSWVFAEAAVTKAHEPLALNKIVLSPSLDPEVSRAGPSSGQRETPPRRLPQRLALAAPRAPLGPGRSPGALAGESLSEFPRFHRDTGHRGSVPTLTTAF
uniref:Uncharacterized protein n=1 Tax=Molossus molossus TaxID=27622 RepID=A0A7J8J042_MOLMO|nr:hypothetical protein HJG59_010243 [Molossus molossus]